MIAFGEFQPEPLQTKYGVGTPKATLSNQCAHTPHNTRALAS